MPPRRYRRGALARSISRIPDHGIEIFVILTGSPAEIGIEVLGSKGGIGKAQRDVILAGSLTRPAPSSTDLDAGRIHPVIRLCIAALGGIKQDIDGRFERQRLEVAPEIAVLLLGHKSYRRHVCLLSFVAGRPSPGD